MATDKKSFLLYTDLIKTVEKLPTEKQAALFMHILRYVNDQDPQTDDLLIEIAFEPIKQQLKRDLVKWESETQNRSSAGKKGMAKRWSEYNKIKQSITSGNSVIQPITNISDNVSVKVNDSVNVNESVKEPSAEKKTTHTHTLVSRNSNWNDLPTPEDVPEPPPPQVINAAIRNVEVMRRIKINQQDALDYWETWKIQYLSGQKHYKSLHEVHSHYLNCIKSQPFNLKNFSNEQQEKQLSPAAKRIAERNKQYVGHGSATGS